MSDVGVGAGAGCRCRYLLLGAAGGLVCIVQYVGRIDRLCRIRQNKMT